MKGVRICSSHMKFVHLKERFHPVLIYWMPRSQVNWKYSSLHFSNWLTGVWVALYFIKNFHSKVFWSLTGCSFHSKNQLFEEPISYFNSYFLALFSASVFVQLPCWSIGHCIDRLIRLIHFVCLMLCRLYVGYLPAMLITLLVFGKIVCVSSFYWLRS